MKTYGHLALNEDKTVWGMKTEPHVAIRLKAMFPRIPKWANLYTFPNIPEVCMDLYWFMSRYPMEMTDEHREILGGKREDEIRKRDELERFLLPGYVPQKYSIKGELRDYQAQAVDIFLKNKTLLIGDVVGLGKTLCGIGALTQPLLLPAVVVVQTHLPPQWKEQIEQFTNAKVHIIKGTKPYSLPPADVYILKYSCIAGWTPTFDMKWMKSVIFDEMQELRRSDSERYRAASILCQNVEYRMGLSATPVYNYGDEIFNVMDLLAPGMMGKREDFLREWCGSYMGKVIKDPKALGAYLKENHLFLRRTREEVGRELPVINKIIHRVEYDEDAVAKMEDLARTLAIRVTTGSFTERGQAARELDLMVRQATGISKAKYVAAYVKILLESGESVLLAGWHRGVYEIWEKEFESFRLEQVGRHGKPMLHLQPVWYTGSESPAQKEESKRKFIEGESNLMIISLRSGIGLDGLQKRSKIVVFGELDWSPGVHEQVTGRLNRDGQPEQVTAIYQSPSKTRSL